MKFGQTDDLENIDLSIPETGFGGQPGAPVDDFAAYVGCSSWNREKLKNFFPKNTTDQLEYYSTQFNSVELNATFYRNFPDAQYHEWRRISAPGFVFFPKINHEVTHVRRLRDFEEPIDEFVRKVKLFEEKLGSVFAQMHNDFGPEGFDRVEAFVKHWRSNYKIPLALEFRNAGWFTPETSNRLYQLLEGDQVTNIIVDTAGRRDLLHMRLTTPIAFVRFVGTGVDEIDKERLDVWAGKIAEWKSIGLEEVYFFVHQHVEKHSPTLAAYFINSFNLASGLNLEPPTLFNLAAPALRP